jgi:hypothetical protein
MEGNSYLTYHVLCSKPVELLAKLFVPFGAAYEEDNKEKLGAQGCIKCSPSHV